MKKTIGIISLFLFAIVLSGCNTNKNTQGNNSQKSTKEDCMTGCFVMWKANPGNKGRVEADMQKDCNSLCDAGQGMQNNDESSCAKAEGVLKDTCYSEIAVETNNPAICEKIESKLFVSSCYISIVEKTKDISLCDKVTDKMMNQVCQEKLTSE